MRGAAAAAAGALAAVGGGAAAAPAPPPPWPYRGFESFPALWFGANGTGADGAAQLDFVGRHSLVGYGWQQNLTAAGGEENLRRAAARLRQRLGARSPPAFVYRNMQTAMRAFAVPWRAAQDPARAARVFVRAAGALRDGGAVCAPHAPFYRWDENPAAAAFWLDEVIGEVAGERSEGGAGAAAAAPFAAVFFDETDWSYCNYGEYHNYGNCSTPGDGWLAADYRAKLPALRDTAVRLHAAGLWPVFSTKNRLAAAAAPGAAAPCLLPEEEYIAALRGVGWIRFYEFWMGAAAADDARDIANAVMEAERGIPVVVRANGPGSPPWAKVPPLEYALGAFLIVQSNHTYFGVSSGWYDKDWAWHAEYDRTYGAPLGPANRSGAYRWTRRFTRCTVDVDCEAQRATIRFTR